MAPESRTATPGLILRLLAETHRFTFFQAVQLLQRHTASATRIGGSGPPEQETVRLRPVLSLAFPKGELEAVRQVAGDDEDAGSARYEMDVALLGLYGTVSPLPTFVTEGLLQQSLEEREHSLVRGFMDLFHHRLLSLLYRCWEKYRYHVQFHADGSDDISQRMLCLLGLGIPHSIKASGIEPVVLLRYLGLFSQKPHSATALGCLLRDYFGVPIDIDQLALRRVPIPPDQRNRLGEANSSLGSDLLLGEEVEDRAGHFRVRIGPTDFPGFSSFLPGSDRFRELEQLCRVFAGHTLEFEVELILQRDAVPPLRVSSGDDSARLGYTTWVGQPDDDDRVRLRQPFLGAA